MTTPSRTDWLTIDDLVTELGLSAKTIGKYLKAGRLPGIQFGHIWRIPVTQWEAYKAGLWTPRSNSNNVTPADFTRRRHTA